jgi:hypothetical protein
MFVSNLFSYPAAVTITGDAEVLKGTDKRLYSNVALHFLL